MIHTTGSRSGVPLAISLQNALKRFRAYRTRPATPRHASKAARPVKYRLNFATVQPRKPIFVIYG